MTSKYSNKYPIPKDFPQILHDFAKEVVKKRPKDILDFSIQYFYSLEKSQSLKSKINDINNLKKDIKDSNVLTNKEEIKDINQPSVLKDGSGIDLMRKNNVNDIPKENEKIYNEYTIEKQNSKKQNELKDNNNLLKGESEFENDENTFSNISGTTNDKIGVRNFYGNIIDEIYKSFEKDEDTFSDISGTTNDKKGVRHFYGNIIDEIYKSELKQAKKDN